MPGDRLSYKKGGRIRVYSKVSMKMSHPSRRMAAPPGGMKMRNPATPYKHTGFTARPSGSRIAGASDLPLRTVSSVSKMPANFCYTPSDLTRVRDQGSCGSCWAVSATSMIADRAYVKSKGKIRCALSAQQLMECSEYLTDTSSVGCEGNDPFTALLSIKEKPVKLVSETEYPRMYTATPSNSSDCIPDVSGQRYSVTAESAFMVTEEISATATDAERTALIKSNVDSMKQSLFNEGPLVVVFEVPDDFKDYDGLTVYEPPEGYVSGSSGNWHAVELVGWGTIPSTKQEYWVCRNSWGQSWPVEHKPGAGMGFFYISMNKNTCSIEQYAVGVTPKLSNISKAPATPDDSFPGEGKRWSIKQGGNDWPVWVGGVTLLIVIGGVVYAKTRH